MLIRFFMVSVLLALPSLVAASIVHEINVARVLVDEQSAEAENAALLKAMEQVFIKMSGNKRVGDNLTVQSAYDDAQSYLISSSISRRDNSLMLEARFNQVALENILKTAGEPIWASLRPTATLWLAKQTAQGDIKWFSQNIAEDFNKTMQQIAFERGLSVVLPIGDLADTMGVSDYDVWTQNTARLEEHSKRYDSPYIISATMKALTDNMREQKQEEYGFISQQQSLSSVVRTGSDGDGGNDPKHAINAQVPDDTAHYELDWIIKGPNHILSGQAFVMNEAQAVYKVMDAYADMLAVKYASKSDLDNSEQMATTALFENVRSLTDYTMITNLLESMPQVTSASLLRIQTNFAYFRVSLLGNTQDFSKVLSIDPRVSAPQAVLPEGTMVDERPPVALGTLNEPKVDMHFVWQR